MRLLYCRSLLLLVLASFLITVPGCERRSETNISPLQPAEYSYVLAIVLDMSGSYAAQMEERAYPFFLEASQDFFEKRIGEEGDRILIAQLSAEQKALLWQGHPESLGQSFPTGESFKQYLTARSNPGGSRVYASVSETLNYLMDLTSDSPDTQLLVLVLSDMESNGEEEEASRKEVQQVLRRFSKRNGAIGLYWVSQYRMEEWRQLLRDAGVEHFRVESEIVVDPKLPEFE